MSVARVSSWLVVVSHSTCVWTGLRRNSRDVGSRLASTQSAAELQWTAQWSLIAFVGLFERPTPLLGFGSKGGSPWASRQAPCPTNSNVTISWGPLLIENVVSVDLRDLLFSILDCAKVAGPMVANCSLIWSARSSTALRMPSGMPSGYAMDEDAGMKDLF